VRDMAGGKRELPAGQQTPSGPMATMGALGLRTFVLRPFDQLRVAPCNVEEAKGSGRTGDASTRGDR
jgi:hypothetical protein